MAVYSEPATLKFKSFEGLLASSGLFAGNEFAAEYKDRLVEFDVEATSLDRYFDPTQRIDFLKVDAEGAETFVLQGAKRVLKENRELCMILEYAPCCLLATKNNWEKFSPWRVSCRIA
jgi:FkbM family methyltransferase